MDINIPFKVESDLYLVVCLAHFVKSSGEASAPNKPVRLEGV